MAKTTGVESSRAGRRKKNGHAPPADPPDLGALRDAVDAAALDVAAKTLALDSCQSAYDDAIAALLAAQSALNAALVVAAG